jgi:hypothetical protein
MRLSCSVLLHLQQQPTNRQNMQLLMQGGDNRNNSTFELASLAVLAACLPLLADQFHERGKRGAVVTKRQPVEAMPCCLRTRRHLSSLVDPKRGCIFGS